MLTNYVFMMKIELK